MMLSLVYTQMLAAISRDLRAISAAESSVFSFSARAAAQCVIAAGADRRNAFVWHDDLAIAADKEEICAICEQEQRFQIARHLFAAPFLGQLHRCPGELPVALLQMIFKFVK